MKIEIAVFFLLFSNVSIACGICDPYDDVVSEMKQLANSPGATKILYSCLLRANDTITALQYRRGAITTKAVAIVCSPEIGYGCTNGVFPGNLSGQVLDEMNEDPDIQQYWGSSANYSGQLGQIGPVDADTLLMFNVRCGESYCKITVKYGASTGGRMESLITNLFLETVIFIAGYLFLRRSHAKLVLPFGVAFALVLIYTVLMFATKPIPLC